jgi:hypothetical protein
MDNKNQGLNAHRFRDNPEEHAFAMAWSVENDADKNRDLLGWLLGDGTRPAEPSDRDRVVAATAIQWLGSPVGQGFLRELGWEKRPKKRR